MPEAKLGLLSYPMDPPKRPPIIKVSCGIGDTDGFPAFDVDSDNYAAPDDPKWGFRITGGAEFHMPITVFQVTDGGLADLGGIRLGDVIVEINEIDVTNLPLAKVQEIIDSSAKKIYIIARGMEDDEMNAEPQEEEKSIVLRVPKPLPPPKASIEERLREMQRKLSEIAEIPKILSSTLQTVSQTFEKFLPPEEGTRRQSQAYESDLDSATDDNGDVLSEPDSLEMPTKYKDQTPESDYVSESNDDDTEKLENNESEGEYEESCDEREYTWNLSNIPEVSIEEDTEDEPEEQREPTAEDICKQEKQERIEKLDRAWPWADREKIIYRQSTCHLVPRQPLGIVEDRIKLLAKRNITALYERRQSEI